MDDNHVFCDFQNIFERLKWCILGGNDDMVRYVLIYLFMKILLFLVGIKLTILFHSS